MRGSGEIFHPVTIQQATVTRDAVTNEQVKNWTTWRTAFASIEAKRGKEFFVDNQRFSETILKFCFHYHDVDGIEPTMRLVHNNIPYDIKTIQPDYARRQKTEIEATLTV